MNLWFNAINQSSSEITILILGQSNAGNRESVMNISNPNKGIAKLYENVNYIEYSNTLTQYSGTLEFSKLDRSTGNFGVELGLISKLPSNRRINLIKYFYGSKGIKQQAGDTDFNPNSVNECYDRGIFKGDGAGFCEQILNHHSLKPDFIIGVWGEQDAVIASTTYESDLEALTNQFRIDFANDNLVFIFNRLHTNFAFINGEHVYPGYTAIRSAEDNFNDNNLNKLIDIDDITIGDPDNVHFNADALVAIGFRFGDYILTKL